MWKKSRITRKVLPEVWKLGYTPVLEGLAERRGLERHAFRLEGQVIRMGCGRITLSTARGRSFRAPVLERENDLARVFPSAHEHAKGTAVKPYLTLNWVHDTKSFGTSDGWGA